MHRLVRFVTLLAVFTIFASASCHWAGSSKH